MFHLALEEKKAYSQLSCAWDLTNVVQVLYCKNSHNASHWVSSCIEKSNVNRTSFWCCTSNNNAHEVVIVPYHVKDMCFGAPFVSLNRWVLYLHKLPSFLLPLSNILHHSTNDTLFPRLVCTCAVNQGCTVGSFWGCLQFFTFEVMLPNVFFFHDYYYYYWPLDYFFQP